MLINTEIIQLCPMKIEIKSVPTEKETSDIEEENLRKALIYVISSSDFERLATDKLKQVYNIVKGKE